jgi:hypothetical protein
MSYVYLARDRLIGIELPRSFAIHLVLEVTLGEVSSMSDSGLRDLALKRLDIDTRPKDEWSALVLAALGGERALTNLLEESGENPMSGPTNLLEAVAESPAKLRCGDCRNLRLRGRGPAPGPEA